MKTKVYFIDDSPTMRYAISSWFKKVFKKIEIITFKEYENIHEYLNVPNLKLIICDEEIGTNKIRGREFIKKLKDIRDDLSIIFISGLELQHDKELRDNPMVKYIFTKPINFDVLKEKIIELT